jgi:hypothetical protein
MDLIDFHDPPYLNLTIPNPRQGPETVPHSMTWNYVAATMGI